MSVRNYKISRCEQNRDLVLKMADQDCSLKEIARKVGTKGRVVKSFLERNGIHKHYPKTRMGDLNPKWRGGRTVTGGGYVLVYAPTHPNLKAGCYVWEHRLVMEHKIGRLLLPEEVVHHVDGNPSNNAPENLQLFSANNEHLAHELKGRTPKWTPEGLARMKKGILLSAANRRGKTRDQIAPHGRWSKKNKSHPTA